MEWDSLAEEEAWKESIEWQKYLSTPEGKLEFLEAKSMFESILIKMT